MGFSFVISTTKKISRLRVNHQLPHPSPLYQSLVCHCGVFTGSLLQVGPLMRMMVDGRY